MNTNTPTPRGQAGRWLAAMAGLGLLYAIPAFYFQGFANAAAYIKFDGIDGEATDADHKDWIVVDSMSWKLSGQSVQGKWFPKVELFDVRKRLDKSSPLLMKIVSEGSSTPSAVFELSKNIGGKPQPYLSYKLSDVLVSSYSFNAQGGSDAVPTDELSLNFSELTMTYIPYDASGRPLTPVSATCKFSSL